MSPEATGRGEAELSGVFYEDGTLNEAFVREHYGLGPEEAGQVVQFGTYHGTVAQMIADERCPIGGQIRSAYEENGVGGVVETFEGIAKLDPKFSVEISPATLQREKGKTADDGFSEEPEGDQKQPPEEPPDPPPGASADGAKTRPSEVASSAIHQLQEEVSAPQSREKEEVVAEMAVPPEQASAQEEVAGLSGDQLLPVERYISERLDPPIITTPPSGTTTRCVVREVPAPMPLAEPEKHDVLPTKPVSPGAGPTRPMFEAPSIHLMPKTSSEKVAATPLVQEGPRPWDVQASPQKAEPADRIVRQGPVYCLEGSKSPAVIETETALFSIPDLTAEPVDGLTIDKPADEAAQETWAEEVSPPSELVAGLEGALTVDPGEFAYRLAENLPLAEIEVEASPIAGIIEALQSFEAVLPETTRRVIIEVITYARQVHEPGVAGETETEATETAEELLEAACVRLMECLEMPCGEETLEEFKAIILKAYAPAETPRPNIDQPPELYRPGTPERKLPRLNMPSLLLRVSESLVPQRLGRWAISQVSIA